MAKLPSLDEQIAAAEEALAYLRGAARFRGQEQLVADVETQIKWLRGAINEPGASGQTIVRSKRARSGPAEWQPEALPS